MRVKVMRALGKGRGRWVLRGLSPVEWGLQRVSGPEPRRPWSLGTNSGVQGVVWE